MKKALFLVESAPYKSESARLAITHALASYTAIIHTDEEIEPVLAFVGEGVFNCIKGQSSEIYGVSTNEYHIKNALASDMKVLVCKEDLEKYGITKDMLVDAKDMGAEVEIQVVSFDEIMKEMESCDHVLFF